ncbi:MAG: lamin tail domain-containing protein [Candidatus Cryptobacteroides sp.]
MKRIILSMAAFAALGLVSCVKDEQDPNALIPEEKPEAPVTLVINEVDPNNKKLEFYNTGSEEISLKGCYLTKDGADKWEFPDVKVAAKGRVVYTARNESEDVSLGPKFGVSATKGFKIELFDKNDKALDVLDNSKESDKFFEFAEGIDPVQTLGRQSDGAAQWVIFCPGSIGESNDKGTFVINWGEALPEPEGALVINEINGNGGDADKYIELYNGTSEEVSLNGYQLYYGVDITWQGESTHVIPSKGYLVLKGAKKTGDLQKGLSAGKYIVVKLVDAEGKEVDVFQRGDGSGEAVADGEYIDKSYSRVPDGSGEWYYTPAEGTAGASNGNDPAGLEKVQ